MVERTPDKQPKQQPDTQKDTLHFPEGVRTDTRYGGLGHVLGAIGLSSEWPISKEELAELDKHNPRVAKALPIIYENEGRYVGNRSGPSLMADVMFPETSSLGLMQIRASTIEEHIPSILDTASQYSQHLGPIKGQQF